MANALLHDPATVRLGRKPKPADDRDLRLARYLTTGTVLPAIPDVVDVSGGLTRWGMLLNDKLGDCTVAGALHMEMAWSKNAGHVPAFHPTDSEALAGYEGACGYNPKDPSTDEGGIERDVLRYWRKSGLGGREIAAFVAVDHTSVEEMRAACDLFGGVYLGVDLQVAQQRQVVWDYEPSGEWGGHAVPLVGYDDKGDGTVVTWGALKKVTAAFIAHQCNEAWAVLSKDLLDDKGTSPAGLDLAALARDLEGLAAIP
jgi:hypothetical protein